MAAIVPTGIDFCGSAKSPDRFDPAMIPIREKKNIYIGMQKSSKWVLAMWKFKDFSVIQVLREINF